MSARLDEARWELFDDLTAPLRERFEADLLEKCELVGVCVDSVIVAEAVDETFVSIRACGLEVEDDGEPDHAHDLARDREVAL